MRSLTVRYSSWNSGQNDSLVTTSRFSPPTRRLSFAGASVAMTLAIALLAAGCAGDDTSAPATGEVLVALALDVDRTGLASAAESVATSSDPARGNFLSLSDIAGTYGAPRHTIDAAVSALADVGVDVEADPTRAVLWGEVDLDTAESVFGVDLEISDTPGGGSIVRPDAEPRVPAGIPGVVGVVGLSGTVAAPPGPTETTVTTPPSCPGGEMTATTLSQGYGLDDLIGSGSSGAGVSIAMLETGAFTTEIYDTYNTCGGAVLSAARVSSSAVPLAPAPQPDNEVALDTVTLGLLVPDAELRVTRFDEQSAIVFPLLTILAESAAAGMTPDVVLSTIGFCERDISPNEIAMAEWLLSALAATGTTTVASVGDVGSSACYPQTDAPSVQYPGSSAWTTAVGGATFSGPAADPADLAVWNETPGSELAGGGGTSAKIARPGWQGDVNQPGVRRVVPDFSAFAEPGGVGAVPTCSATGCNWQEFGGTSLTATVVAAGVGLSAGQPGGGVEPRRFGHLGPTIAAAARTRTDTGVFADITVGNNHVFADRCCRATRGYDQASGWGLVDIVTLLGDLSD